MSLVTDALTAVGLLKVPVVSDAADAYAEVAPVAYEGVREYAFTGPHERKAETDQKWRPWRVGSESGGLDPGRDTNDDLVTRRSRSAGQRRRPIARTIIAGTVPREPRHLSWAPGCPPG